MGDGGASPSAGIIDSKSNEILSRHEPAGKRGPGRPRKDGQPSRPIGKTPSDAPKSDAVSPPIDRKFIEDAAKEILTIADNFITSRIHRGMMRIDDSLKEQADSLVNSVTVTNDEKALVAKTCGAIAEKYPGLFGYAPELTLVIFAVGYGARVTSALSEVKQLAIAKEAMGHADSSQAE